MKNKKRFLRRIEILEYLEKLDNNMTTVERGRLASVKLGIGINGIYHYLRIVDCGYSEIKDKVFSGEINITIASALIAAENRKKRKEGTQKTSKVAGKKLYDVFIINHNNDPNDALTGFRLQRARSLCSYVLIPMDRYEDAHMAQSVVSYLGYEFITLLYMNGEEGDFIDQNPSALVIGFSEPLIFEKNKLKLINESKINLKKFVSQYFTKKKVIEINKKSSSLGDCWHK